jgi:hypothetical protein
MAAELREYEGCGTPAPVRLYDWRFVTRREGLRVTVESDWCWDHETNGRRLTHLCVACMEVRAEKLIKKVTQQIARGVKKARLKV